jgi:mRNA interferase MazF
LVRGDVVTIATGSGYGGKPRPAVIVQSDLLAEKDTVVVLGFTSEVGKVSRWRPMIEPDATNGLVSRSAVMADVPILARRSKIDRFVGRLSALDMKRVDQALMLVFDLQ